MARGQYPNYSAVKKGENLWWQFLEKGKRAVFLSIKGCVKLKT